MKVRVERTIRKDGHTYLKDRILEVSEEEAKALISKGLVISLDKALAEALEEKEVVEKIIEVPMSYKELCKKPVSELDDIVKIFEIELKENLKKPEKVEAIWEHLSGSFLEEDNEQV